MTTSVMLRELERNYANSSEFDPDFLQTVEDHFPIILEKMLFSIKEVTPQEALVSKGDFHGLLAKKNIHASLHAITTSFNGLTKSSDFDGRPMNIKYIDPEVIETLKKTYEARKR